MVKYSMFQFFQLMEVVMHHFDKYKLDPNLYEIKLNNVSKRNTLDFQICKIKNN